MRITLKVAYIGTDYHGFQVQPDARTIEGELFAALGEIGLITDPHEARYIAAGRTDKGVHAIGQVIAFDTDNPELAVPRIINSKLPPAIWTWARAQVHSDFDPRRDPVYRVYRYIMCGKYDISTLRNASKILKGEHDFSNFSTPDKDRTGTCMIEMIGISVEREFTIIDVRARFFLWHMVRKIAAALKMVGNGSRDESWLKQMLYPDEYTEGIQPAPAYGLILKNIEYENINWVEDEYAKKKISENLEKQFLWNGVMAEMLRELRESMTDQSC
ncbi:MAG: tRNA pseudouridine(38-40) synthase TruA [Candidatus Methanoperedens sp.]|nr:tRNA pseudouridine(38-40) synthase TruA [Candidatus Methanoperedens sp.]MCE8424477.1 tRNA pseudouridine(38-40) synthase TruA [Candidatus Methanoperedens sp.]MCE8426972.1 tRNA pseudouridine(38-40) synthase TruA [Candidatus Methanoperedens sp.]